MPYTNITNKHYDSGDYPAALLEAKEMIGLDAFRAGARRDALGRVSRRRLCQLHGAIRARHESVRRMGTSSGCRASIKAFVKLTPDGALEVRSGIHTIGQGLETTLAQIAAR